MPKVPYVQLDANAFDDPKMALLLQRQRPGNWDVYGRFWRLCQLLRISPGYRIPDSPEGVKMVAWSLRIGAQAATKYLSTLVEVGLLVKRDSYLLSLRLASDAADADAESDAKRRGGLTRAEQVRKRLDAERSPECLPPNTPGSTPDSTPAVDSWGGLHPGSKGKVREGKVTAAAADLENRHFLELSRIISHLPAAARQAALLECHGLADDLAQANAPLLWSERAVAIFIARQGRSIGLLRSLVEQSLRAGAPAELYEPGRFPAKGGGDYDWHSEIEREQQLSAAARADGERIRAAAAVASAGGGPAAGGNGADATASAAPAAAAAPAPAPSVPL